MTVMLIDYGLSNLLSVRRALEYLGADVKVVNTGEDLEYASKIVLPGVGAFRDGMEGLRKLSLIEPLKQKVKENIPLLGICLGMQMLFDESDEFGIFQGLGFISGRVERIPLENVNGKRQCVPNIGWRELVNENNTSKILSGIDVGSECYFVHSYEAKAKYKENVVAYAPYGGRNVCAVVQRNNVIGTQFHPEKSGEVGLHILKNFLEM